MSFSSLSRQHFFLIATLAIGAGLVFLLPWLMPPTRRVISDSYNLGFNNAVAILGVGATLLALTILRLRTSKKEADVSFPLRRDIGHLFSRDVFLPACVAGIAALLAWVAWLQLPLHYYSEIRWFIPSIELILLGRSPYTQFQWNYGPLFLYLPVWLVRVSNGAIGADTAYIFTLLLCTATGLGLLAYMTTVLKAGQRAAFFMLASLPFVFNISLGLNYTALRFTAPFAALLWLHSSAAQIETFAFQRGAAFKPAFLKPALVFAGGAIFCFAISPESGLGFFAAALFYFAALARSQSRETRVLLMGCAAAGIVAGAIFLRGVSRDYFLSVLSFGGGGGNFPIVPSLPILFYLGTLAFVVPVLAAYGMRNKGEGAALALSWAALATIFAAPALGRSDPGHLFCNGLGVFLGACLLLQNAERRKLPIYQGAFALLFSFGLPLIALDHSAGALGAVWRASQNGERKADRRFWQPAPPDAGNREKEYEIVLKPYRQIGTPLGCDENMEIFLKRSRRFVPEFFTPPAQNPLTEKHIAQKIASIGAMPWILVPKTAVFRPDLETHKRQYASWRGEFLSRLLLFPIGYRWASQPLFPELESAAFIRRNFSVAGELGEYLIMRRKQRSGQENLSG